MNWLPILELAYGLLVGAVILKIIYDNRDPSKTLGFILLVIFVPLLGVIMYFLFGFSKKRSRIYEKKLLENLTFKDDIQREGLEEAKQFFKEQGEKNVHNKKLVYLLQNQIACPVTVNNKVMLLNNGENKFPLVLEDLKKAKHHIHLEYYTYQDDEIGRQIEDIMIQKVKEGVKVRFIYDDWGSFTMSKGAIKRMKDGGVEVYPFYEIKLFTLGRANYRNHRKIILIDGHTAFVGGINVSDVYINKEDKSGKNLFWRDTHLKIYGSGAYFLQYIFLSDWNFCSNQKLQPNRDLFPPLVEEEEYGSTLVQFAASGPDSKTPTIQHSILQAIALADEEILITTPYFIPGESLKDALIIAASSGVKVKLLVPRRGDNKIVDIAAASYFETLLEADIEIYRYNKGFVHAKTMVVDGEISIVGTANMDIRSFDLNFEVNAILYDDKISKQIQDAFFEDIQHAERIELERWRNRSTIVIFIQQLARLFSPIL